MDVNIIMNIFVFFTWDWRIGIFQQLRNKR